MELKIKYLISTKCLLLEVQNDNTNNWYVKSHKSRQLKQLSAKVY